MKKKTIEKIPYLGLKKVSRKREVKYIGVTAIKIVGHEKHLFVEVYKNEKDSKKIPEVRIVLTKKDFGTYFPESGEWTRKKCEDGYSYTHRLIWRNGENRLSNWEQLEQENILQSEEDLERIRKYCGGRIWKQERWWEYIEGKQDRIASEERWKVRKRELERRQQALRERAKNTRALPERKILERADMLYFHNQHYLYYKKHGCWVQIACSACGGVTDARWKCGISYESQFQIRTEDPREGRTGRCPICGAYGEYKCKGKVKGIHSKTIHMFLGQKYKEKGMVLRYIEIEKKWNLGLVCGEKEEEMYNASEELSGIEIARAYFEPGKKRQIDYQKYNPYTGEDFWDDCNLYGNNNIMIKSAPIMRETYEEMNGTMFQYSALKEYEKEVGEVDPINYFTRYQETPQIEILVKMGLFGVVEQLLGCRYGIIADRYARRLDEFLGIRKERVKRLIASKGNVELLEAMQVEKDMQQIWTDEQVMKLAETGLKGRVKRALEYMSIQKILNRIGKYAGCEYGTGCSSAEARIRQTATTYMDYIGMRIERGYDMHNTVYQNPRSLSAAHAEMVMETNREEIDKRMRETEAMFPEIRKKYRKLRIKYLYEDADYIIRPARSAQEIVMEGRILNHCVGRDGYLRSHNDGKTYILMLRRKTEAEVPYITVEIDGTRPMIVQWYGAGDKKPDQENMQRWLDDYIDRLRNESVSTEQEAKIAIA